MPKRERLPYPHELPEGSFPNGQIYERIGENGNVEYVCDYSVPRKGIMGQNESGQVQQHFLTVLVNCIVVL